MHKEDETKIQNFSQETWRKETSSGTQTLIIGHHHNGLKEIGCEDVEQIQSRQDRDERWALRKTTMDLKKPLINKLVTDLQLPTPKICIHVYLKANVITGFYGDVHLCHDRTCYIEISINIRFRWAVLEVYLCVVTILLLWQVECELIVNCEVIWKRYMSITPTVTNR